VKINAGAAKSYAKALFDLARERNQADQIQTEIDQIAQQIAGDAELMAVLGRPWVTPAVKQQIAKSVGERLQLSKLGQDFLALVASHGRADHLAAIAETYRGMLDAAHGRVRARVRTAGPLTAADRTALGERLGRALASNAGSAKPLDVVIEEVLDKHLLGGFVAEIGSMVVDGSLDGQLARLRERLVKG
jgi:F-type H+-transporting ATPase subunit delta